jgi:hypothetical protein
MMFLKRIFERLNKVKFLPEMVFILLFLFSYLPHFIYAWMPQLLTDTYAYVFIAKDISEGALPLAGHRMDVPYGYSLFFYVILAIGGNLKTVILLQTVLFGSAFVFLIRCLKKISFKVAFLSAIILWLYASSSQSLLWNTLIYTESIYTSTLVVVTGFLIKYFLERKVKYIYWLAGGVFLGLYIRTNGMYLFFIPGILFLEAFLTKRSNLKHVVFSTLLVLTVSSFSNLIVKGYFLPGETLRIISKLKGEGEYFAKDGDVNSENNLKKWNAVLNSPTQKRVYHDPLVQSYKLFTHIANTKFGNHYYYRMPRQIKNINYDGVKFLMENKNEILRYKTGDDSLDNHARYILSNFEFDRNEVNEMLQVLDIEIRPRNLWLLVNHAIELAMPLHRNWIVLILFYVFFLWSVFKFFQSSNKFQSIFYLVILIGCVHLVSLLFLSLSVVSDNAYPRYAIVSEFSIFLVVLLGIKAFKNRLKDKHR